MITLKSLTWSNMFSYGENNSIQFDEEPLVQIVGFNGSGKSSIPSILEENLFNKNSKGIKKGDVLNRGLDTNKYQTECKFSIFDDEFELKVKRTGATQKVTLLKNGCDISSHTATETFKQVESLLGLDQKAFSQLVYQSSSNSLQFLTATDTNRKKFLIDLLSLDKYVKAFEEVKVLHKAISDKQIKTSSKLDTTVSMLEKLKKSDLTPKEIWAYPTVIDPALTDKRGVLKETLNTLEARNRAISNNNLYIKSRNAINANDLVVSEVLFDTTSIKALIASYKAEIKQDTLFITKHSKSETTCYACGQALPEDKHASQLEEYKQKVADAQTTLVGLESSLKTHEARNATIEAKKASITEFERLTALINESLPVEEHNAKSIKAEIDEIDHTVAVYNDEVEFVNKQNTSAAAHNAKIKAIREQLTELSAEIAALESDLSIVNKELSNLEILKKVFSTNGLIAYKLESSVKELEVLANEYLGELSDGRFQLSFEIVNDKLNVVIADNGDSIDIAALSAGELARVNTATLLAIRRLMASMSKSRINLLFLDEVIDTLDTNGKEKLIEVLLKEDSLNTFLVSHGYSHPLLKKINAIKENGISRLEDG